MTIFRVFQRGTGRNKEDCRHDICNAAAGVGTLPEKGSHNPDSGLHGPAGADQPVQRRRIRRVLRFAERAGGLLGRLAHRRPARADAVHHALFLHVRPADRLLFSHHLPAACGGVFQVRAAEILVYGRRRVRRGRDQLCREHSERCRRPALSPRGAAGVRRGHVCHNGRPRQ